MIITLKLYDLRFIIKSFYLSIGHFSKSIFFYTYVSFAQCSVTKYSKYYTKIWMPNILLNATGMMCLTTITINNNRISPKFLCLEEISQRALRENIIVFVWLCFSPSSSQYRSGFGFPCNPHWSGSAWHNYFTTALLLFPRDSRRLCMDSTRSVSIFIS